MNIEQIKANAPEGAEHYSRLTEDYYKSLNSSDGISHVYIAGKWREIDSLIPRHPNEFIDLRDQAQHGHQKTTLYRLVS